MPARKSPTKRVTRVTNAPAADPRFEISDRVKVQAVSQPSARGYDFSRSRLLRIYTLDPSVSSLLGGRATVAVPYEELQPGPRGAVFEVVSTGMPATLRVEPSRKPLALDLNERDLLLSCGLSPTPADGRFHLQMVYAVCSLTYAVFQRALGRDIIWASGVRERDDEPFRLRVFPFAMAGKRNANFDPDIGAISFGFFNAGKNPGGHTVPEGMICTALSHDVIAHETTHALLHALRAQFATPSNPDVLGFHEGFADIVALLMHFSYPDVVLEAVRASKGAIANATLLTDLARQFGQATSKSKQASALRTALDTDNVHAFDSDAFASGMDPDADGPLQYDPSLEPHRMGSVLVSAVFEAFATALRRRSARYFRLAGLTPDTVQEKDLSDELLRALAGEATETARQFLNICIRAIDFCPPVDIRMGEYLRALITADADAVADDKYGYREALMRSFQRRRIFPEKIGFMSEDAVRWMAPPFDTPIPGLALRDLRFGDDFTMPADAAEMQRRACALGEFVVRPEIAKALHFVPVDQPLPKNVNYAAPIRIESIRTARRVTPDGRAHIEMVAEVTQSCTVLVDGQAMDFAGGCTLIIGPSGRVRYAIYKKVNSKNRPREQHAFATGTLKDFWQTKQKTLSPRGNMLAQLHGD